MKFSHSAEFFISYYLTWGKCRQTGIIVLKNADDDNEGLTRGQNKSGIYNLNQYEFVSVLIVRICFK